MEQSDSIQSHLELERQAKEAIAKLLENLQSVAQRARDLKQENKALDNTVAEKQEIVKRLREEIAKANQPKT